MDRVAAAVTGRRSWLLALIAAALGVGLMAVIGGNAAAGQSPQSVPVSAQSARVDALARQFAGGETAPLIVVVTRIDGGALAASDRAAAQAARARALAAAQPGANAAASPLLPSSDGRAAMAVVPLNAELSGLALADAVTTLRTAAATGLPAQLQVHVTGGPAFGADIAGAFAGANITLLAVTTAVVALLLIATYRSPVLWLVPLLVVGFADRVAAAIGTAVASLTGLSFDGATSGITSVLVFGAGTNYALLLISRYRQELRRHCRHRAALREAVRGAGPAIVASNATVVAALLTLLLASTPSTRSLGALAACGLAVAAISVLVILPPLLAVGGRRLFWPFVPRPGDGDTLGSGAWLRVAEWVNRRPALVATVTVAVLVGLGTGLLGTRIGLTQTEQFRVRADSVVGYNAVAQHFPAGVTNPALIIGRTNLGASLRQAIIATPGVVSVTESGRSRSGVTKWSAVIDAPPSSRQAFTAVAALRDSTRAIDSAALVGGPDAQALDVRDAATHDRLLLIPAILAVILVVVYVVLRSALAPPTLLAATILGALAALGMG
ncbi:hypothetical protein BST14_21740, partial [Mycobacterium arosiense ATCC BAA-1401 = DSM 45069]